MSQVARANIAERLDAPVIVDLSQARELSRKAKPAPLQGIYGGLVTPPDSSVRLAAFSAFVRRALDQARLRRNWSVEQVAAASGLGVNTIYQWRKGAAAFPEGEKVRKFCAALSIAPAVAFGILWPADDDVPAEPMPLGPEEDLLELAKRLSDPSVSVQEKFLIRETIKALAARIPESKERSRRRASG
jgi:transcriptional regulator with XRE-family HTH domain